MSHTTTQRAAKTTRKPTAFPAAAFRATAALGAAAMLLLGMHPAQAATDTWVGNISPNFATVNGFNVIPSSGDSLTFGPAGAAGTTLNNNLAAGFNFASLTFNTNASAYTIGGNSFNLSSGITDNALNAETINAAMVLTANQTFNVSSMDGVLTVGGISGAFTLTKTGAGLLSLGSGTSFSNLTILGGTVQAGGDNNLGSTTGTVTIDGGTLRLSLAGNFAFIPDSTRSYKLGDAGAGTGGTIDTDNASGTFGGVLSNNGGTNSFTKTGSGNLTLTGTNTYTGATNINQGTLSIDFNSKGNTTPAINSASALVLGGTPTVLGTVANGQNPTLYVQGLSNTAVTQTFNGLTLNAGTSNIGARAIGANTANLTLAFGAITHNAGGIVNFSAIGSGGTGTGVFTTTNTNDASGILGGWAAINTGDPNATSIQNPTDYATVNGSNQIVAYTGYTTQAAGAIASNTNNNDRVSATGGVALTVAAGTTDINTLSLAPAATGNETVAITGTLRLGANGGMLIGNGAGNLTLNGGSLTAGGSAVANNPGEINLITNNSLTISSNIVNNGTGAVTLSFSRFNTTNNGQSLTLGGANTYSGGTYLNSGRILANTNTAFGTGAVTVAADAQAYLNYGGTMANQFNIIGQATGGFDTNSAIRFQGGQTLSGKVNLLGDAQIALRGGSDTISGQITGNGNLTIGDGNGTGTLTLSNTGTANNWTGNLYMNNENVQLGASNQIPDGALAGNVFVGNGTTLALNGFSDTINGLSQNGTTTVGQGTVSNTATGASVLTVGANDQTSIFNGLVTDGGAGKTLGITKTGSGTLTLGDNANAYAGGTTINGGTLKLGATINVTNSTIGKTTGALAVNTGGTLDLNGLSQTVGAFSGTGGVVTSNNPSGTPTLTVGDGTTTTFAGSIQDGTPSGGGVVSLTKQGSGTTDLTGTNTYTGATSVTAGALQIGSGGSINSASAVTLSGTASLILGDATGSVSQTLNSLTTVAGTSVVGGNASTPSTLTLNGAGTAVYANAFGGATATSQNLNLIIAGTGTTPTSTLSGTSTYTGTTTVNSGDTLNLTGALGNTAVTVNSGGTLSGNGNGTSTGLIGGTVNAVGGSAITLATPGTQLKTTGAVALGTAGAYNSTDFNTLNYTLGASNTTEALNTASVLTANNAFVNITNPSLTGTYTLANYSSLTAGYDFSLSSTAGNVLTQNLGRNSETLTVNPTNLMLTITGAGAPNVAFFDGVVSKVWNDLSNPNFVNFSTNLAGTADAGNVPGATSDVILNAANATTNQGNPLTETLGASTIINSLNVNGNGTTTLGNPGDTTTLTINAAGDSNTASDGSYTGNTAGTGINVMSGANPFTVNVPLILGGSQSYNNASASAFTINGTVTGQGGAANTLTLANTSTGATTLNGAIANGAAGTLALLVNNTGTGATILSSANGYSGGTTLTAGTLQLSGSGTLGSTSGALTVNGGALDLNGTSQAVGALSGTGGVILNSAAGAKTLTVGTGNTGGTYSGVLEDNAGTGGTLGLIKTGTGTETLSGTNTYSGGTTVNQGTLTSAVSGGYGTGNVTVNPTFATNGATDNATLNTNGSIASTAAVTVNSEASDGGFGIGTINFNGAAPTIGSLAGNGKAVLNNAGGTNLTVGSTNNLSSTFSGVISNGAGTGSLTKAGTGTLTLTGTNTYTGGTTVNAGTLATTDDVNAFGTNGSGTTVFIGNAGTVLINSNTNNTYSDTFSGSGLLKFAFPGAGSDTVVNNFNAFTGTLEVGTANGGGNKLQIQSNVPTNLAGATLQIDNGGQYFTGGDVNFGTINLQGTGNNEGRGAIRLNGSGSTSGVIGGNLVLQGNTTIGNEGGVLTGNISTGVAGTSTLTMGTGNSNGFAGLAGNISNGTGTLALVISNGTTYLTGTNSYTGGTTVNSGSQLGVTTNSLPGNATDNGILAFDQTLPTQATKTLNANGTTSVGTTVADGTYAGVISGSGVVNKNNAGTVTFTGANTYTGATSVNGGALTLGTGASLGGTAVTVASGKTLNVTGATSNIIGTAGSGKVTNSGGTISLASGAVNTLNINNSTSGATALTLTGPDALTFDVAGSSVDSIILGSGLKGSVTGTTTINLNDISGGTLTPGTYTLINAPGGGLGTTGNFSLATTTLDGLNLSLSDNGTLLQLIEAPTTTATTYTLAAAVTGGSNLRAGSGTTTVSSTINNTGTGTADSITFTGLGDGSTGGTVNGATTSGTVAAGSSSTNGGQTFTAGSTPGTVTINPNVTSATNTTLGGNATLTSTTSASVNVYSGQETYTGPSGSYGTSNATVQTQWNQGGAPGIDAGFTGQDTATINGTGNSNVGQTVTLDGANPNLAAVTLGNGATLAQGTGGTLTLDGTHASVSGGTDGTATLTSDGSATTVSAPVTLATNTTATVAAGGNLTLSGVVSGSATLTKSGAGIITLTAPDTYSGGTLVTGGVLAVNTTTSTDGTGSGSALSGGGGVTLSGGGTLRNANLSGTANTTDTPNTNNFQNGGFLTIGTNGGFLDFGVGNTGAVFNFTGFSDLGNDTLQVLNYTGNFTDGTNGGDGLDQFLIGGTPLTTAQLNDIQFVNPNGLSGTYTPLQLADGEISPAPEPGEVATLSMIGLGLGGLILRARKRMQSAASNLSAG